MFAILLLIALLGSAYSFAPSNPITRVTITRREAPKMVIWCSIKSTFDLGRYALKQIDTFQGTGVWSFVGKLTNYFIFCAFYMYKMFYICLSVIYIDRVLKG